MVHDESPSSGTKKVLPRVLDLQSKENTHENNQKHLDVNKKEKIKLPLINNKPTNNVDGKTDNRTRQKAKTWRHNMLTITRLYEMQLSTNYIEPTEYGVFQNLSNSNTQKIQQGDNDFGDKRFKASALTR